MRANLFRHLPTVLVSNNTISTPGRLNPQHPLVMILRLSSHWYGHDVDGLCQSSPRTLVGSAFLQEAASTSRLMCFQSRDIPSSQLIISSFACTHRSRAYGAPGGASVLLHVCSTSQRSKGTGVMAICLASVSVQTGTTDTKKPTSYYGAYPF